MNKELFEYNSCGLLTKYTKLDWLSNNNPYCPIEIYNMFGTEWQYRYYPFNEREQKRMTYAYDNNRDRIGNSNINPYPWVYYLLGINNEQYSVNNGYQTKIGDESFVTLWAKEYNVVGAGCIDAVSFALEAGGFNPGYQEFKSHDREGNVWEAKTLNEITRIRCKVIKEKNSGATIDLNKKREEVNK